MEKWSQRQISSSPSLTASNIHRALSKMSHTQIDVRYVAKLARLDLTEEEISTFQSQLESIMAHVESLSSLDLPEDLETNDHSLLAIMRDDSPKESLPAEAVLRNSPDQAQSQIRVPKVVADA